MHGMDHIQTRAATLPGDEPARPPSGPLGQSGDWGDRAAGRPPSPHGPRRRPRRDARPPRGAVAHRLQPHGGARAPQRRRLAPQPRLGLPDPPAAGGRGPDPDRRGRRGPKPFDLTDAARTHVESTASSSASRGPGRPGGVGEERRALRGLIGQIAAATIQVGRAGDDAQVAERARKRGGGPPLALPHPRRETTAEAQARARPEQRDAERPRVAVVARSQRRERMAHGEPERDPLSPRAGRHRDDAPRVGEHGAGRSPSAGALHRRPNTSTSRCGRVGVRNGTRSTVTVSGPCPRAPRAAARAPLRGVGSRCRRASLGAHQPGAEVGGAGLPRRKPSASPRRSATAPAGVGSSIAPRPLTRHSARR